MARSLSASMVTEVTSNVMSPIVLIKLEFDSGDLNLWTGIGNITFNGDTYTGAGDVIDISTVQETTKLKRTLLIKKIIFTLIFKI